VLEVMKLFLKQRRDRWVTKVIENGRELRQAEAARRGVDASQWPDDCAYLDNQIEHLKRKRDRLLQNLKETA
jgi:hypothetical protein